MPQNKQDIPYQGKSIERTDHPHIVKVQGVASGEPIILGTRIMVRTIIEQYQLRNSVEEILWDFPQLNSAQIHDALSYYHDHKQEMDVLLEQATYEYWKSRIAKVNRRHTRTHTIIIEDEEERQRLKQILKACKLPESVGLIARTVAEEVPSELLPFRRNLPGEVEH